VECLSQVKVVESFIKTLSYLPFPDACDLPQDSGECQNFDLKWYYNKDQKMCSRFWYGGCGGNRNRFETQEECEFLCIKSF
uniref:BPTI/Kunitz inhibitor domain-containing protein n=1 Tax=Anser brachyrhynchus TaxID=132585 RepID=A0A8B9BF20_9AVES